jgi:hypothetical protein
MDNLEKSISDLSKFLKKNNIIFSKIEPSTTTTLYLDDKVYITGRSSFHVKHEEYGLNFITIEMVKKYIYAVSCAFAFEGKNEQYEKMKANEVMCKIDRTLKNNKLKISFNPSSSFGGYSDTRTNIVIYDPPMEPIEQYLKIAPGINYHELGHVLYTCSFKELAKHIRKRYIKFDPESFNYTKTQLDNAVNAVLRIVNTFEDGRIENLMANRYGSVIPYFKNTIFNFLLAHIKESLNVGETMTALNCVLISSRKYIDYEYRKWVFEEYMKGDPINNTEEKATRINAYVNKFITLSWTKNRDEMLDLCMGFFFEFVKPELKSDNDDLSGWKKALSEMLGKLETALNNIDSSEDLDIDDTESNILKQILKDMANDVNKNSKQDSSSNSIEDSDDKSANNNHSDDSDKKAKEQEKNIADKLKQEKNKVEEQLKDKSINLKNNLKKTRLEQKKNLRYEDNTVDIDMKREESRLEKKLKEFERKCRNGYQTRKKKGSVDIGEARRQAVKGGTRVFKQYKHNAKKALDIDIAFVLDCSGSMSYGGNIVTAAKQLWIASTACKAIGAKINIFTFSNYDLGNMEPPKNKNKYRVPKTVCDTVISESMYKAENYLNCSKSNTKWFISLTDGELQDKQEHNEILKRMKRDKIACGKINLDYSGAADDENEYDFVLNMNSGESSYNMLNGNNIVSFFKNIYELSLKRAGVE